LEKRVREIDCCIIFNPSAPLLPLVVRASQFAKGEVVVFNLFPLGEEG